MIRSFLQRGIRRFEKRYDYDAGYMKYVVDASTSAGLRLSALQFFAHYTGPRRAHYVWAGAVLGSTLEGDCGPCVQLVLDMAIEGGVPEDQLALCMQGLANQESEVGLGFLFAQAAIKDTLDLEPLRQKIESRYGAEAVVAVSFAASSGRIYPVLKRGLGFGQTCTKVRIGGQDMKVSHQT